MLLLKYQMTVHSFNLTFFASINSNISLQICFSCIFYSYSFPPEISHVNISLIPTLWTFLYIFFYVVYILRSSADLCLPTHAVFSFIFIYFFFMYFHLFFLYYYLLHIRCVDMHRSALKMIVCVYVCACVFEMSELRIYLICPNGQLYFSYYSRDAS